MHGLGNDFVVIDATKAPFSLSQSRIAEMADRHTGVGFDQLLVLESATSSSADFIYRIFNADGGEVEQCGNGARCVAKFAIDSGLISRTTVQLQTVKGMVQVSDQDDDTIAVTLSEPIIAAQNPQTATVDGREVVFYFVDVGNPHAVVVIDNFDDIGFAQALAQDNTLFPDGVNVGLMNLHSPDEASLVVYERGSGWTAACGSGACAAMAVARHDLGGADSMVIHQQGGDLTICWEGVGYSLTMQGPAATVFHGEWLAS